MDKLNQPAGKSASVWNELDHTVTLGGVGKHCQKTNKSVTVPTTIAGMQSQFKSTVIPNSDLPALLGLRSLKQKNAVLDIRNNQLIMPKETADVKIHYDKAKVTVIDLVEAPGGYLMIPCSTDVIPAVPKQHPSPRVGRGTPSH